VEFLKFWPRNGPYLMELWGTIKKFSYRGGENEIQVNIEIKDLV
jgi:hypothetical protein